MSKRSPLWPVMLAVSLQLFALPQVAARDAVKLRKADPPVAAERKEEPRSSHGGCRWLHYACNLSYFFPLPDEFGDDYFNRRFTPPGCCTLRTIEFVLHDDYTGFSNTAPGIDVYVWANDGDDAM